MAMGTLNILAASEVISSKVPSGGVSSISYFLNALNRFFFVLLHSIVSMLTYEIKMRLD